DTNNVSLSVYENGGAYYSEDSPALIKNISPTVESVQSSYLITILSEGTYYDLVISAEENQNYLDSTGLPLSGSLKIEGTLYSDNLIIPSEINGYIFEGSSSDLFVENRTEQKPIEITAEYVSTGVFSNVSNSFDQSFVAAVPEDESVLSAAGRVSPEEPDSQATSIKNNVSYYVTAIPYTNLEQVYLTKTLEIGDRIMTFDAYMSLHSVSEISDIMTSFLPWFLLGSMFMALIIAAIYSRTVSRPIIRITNAADCMASMDLDVKSDVRRKDELGRLSDSLNTLALNLHNAMQELVDKNKKLAEDFARKEREEESRKAFIANASHELKTPLGVIKGYTEAIKDGVRADKHNYYMDVILDEIFRMDNLLEDMMKLSKSEAVS
ncbi:MAG: HAMP domain-containing protein, partial [Clostridia bacterium]|nr:HAMP domain-containing protein [Clostridia bacterium]